MNLFLYVATIAINVFIYLQTGEGYVGSFILMKWWPSWIFNKKKKNSVQDHAMIIHAVYFLRKMVTCKSFVLQWWPS
jgi:hypothetical protein